ncbi:Mitochondrial Ribosomal Protein Large [Trichostrongylus colubriformis]|uniref:Large ribosomal subunit protein bL17m n=1 Tax=Trichostrongylus colubriformis TaxID=6319 RepID=A0AAN8FIX9_TRICO
MANRVVATLPRIRATIGHIPQRLKTANIEPSSRARLEILRRIVTRLVREERAELPWNRAVEARPYVERLIQLGVERGEHDEYTTEMMEWWLLEPDLITKMHNVIVPRFTNREAPFTSIYRLPTQRLQSTMGINPKWRRYDIAVLEIDGNPFPPVLGEKPDNSWSLLNVLLRDSLQNRLKKLQMRVPD